MLAYPGLGFRSRPGLLCECGHELRFSSPSSLICMMVGPPQWHGEDQLGSSISQNKGEMTADIPLPLCQQVRALAGDGVCFQKGAPFPWHKGTPGFPRCALLGPQQPGAGAFSGTPEGACEAPSCQFTLVIFSHSGPGSLRMILTLSLSLF